MRGHWGLVMGGPFLGKTADLPGDLFMRGWILLKIQEKHKRGTPGGSAFDGNPVAGHHFTDDPGRLAGSLGCG